MPLNSQLSDFAENLERAIVRCLNLIRPWHVLLLLSALLLLLTGTRNYLAFGVETDFLGIFIPEAERIAVLNIPEVTWHPPGYAAVLAFFHIFLRDWIVSGYIVSILSSLVLSWAVYQTFIISLGRLEALFAMGSVFWCSSLLTHSVSASSDLLFVALFYSAGAMALLAHKSMRMQNWLLCGALVGFGWLTRANGITLLCLIAAPLFFGSEVRIRSCICICLGLLVPIGAWSILAAAGDTSFMPAGNHLNLAATYFSDNTSGDDLAEMAKRFDGLVDVLLYDPWHLATSYVKDLLANLQTILLSGSLISLPMVMLTFPGLVLLAIKGNRALFWLIVLLILPQLMVVNLKLFHARYYLFLAPMLAASAAVTINVMFTHLRQSVPRVLLIGVAGTIGIATISATISIATQRIHGGDQQIGSVIGEVDTPRFKSSCAGIVSRKPHVPFYLGCPQIYFSPMDNLAELGGFLYRHSGKGPVYVYFGQDEIARRSDLFSQISSHASLEWLEAFASGSGNGNVWILYEFSRHAYVEQRAD